MEHGIWCFLHILGHVYHNIFVSRFVCRALFVVVAPGQLGSRTKALMLTPPSVALFCEAPEGVQTKCRRRRQV